MSEASPAISGPEFERLVRSSMSVGAAFDFRVDEMQWGEVQLSLAFHERQLWPGGTIAGPAQFTLADTALWAATLSVVGPVPLAVTSDMSIRFLKKPLPRGLVARARLLKPRGRLFVGEVHLYSEGDPEPVTHVTGTYAVPRRAT